MKWRIAFLLAALVMLLAAIAYDTRIAARVLASRQTDTALARRFAEIEKLIRFQGSRDAHVVGDFVGVDRTHRQGNTNIAGAAGASVAGSGKDPRQLIAGDATLRTKYMANFRDGLDTQYGLFVHMLGLSPEEEAQFKQLIANGEATKLQVAETADADGLDSDDPQMQALTKQLNRPNWKGLQQLLGPSGITALQQYWSEWPVVTLVQNFGGSLPEPTLTANQAQALLPVLSAASQRDAIGTVIPDTINVPQALNAAAPILSPEQAFTLSAMLQEAEAKAKISQLSQGQ